MDSIAYGIQNLPDIQTPRQIHVKIMRRILYAQFKTPLNILLGLLAISAVNSVWRLWLRLDNTGAWDFLKHSVTDFEFDRSYTFESLKIFFGMVSPTLIVACALNLALLCYVIYLHVSFRNKIQRSNLL